MSDVKQAQRQNLERIADAPPTQPQSLPEAPTMQQVRDEAILLSLVAGQQGVRELFAHFGAESADDLAEPHWAEFVRLANMSCAERAEVFRSKRTARPAIAADLNGNATITMRDRAVELARQGFPVFPLKAGSKGPPIVPANCAEPPTGEYHDHIPSKDPDKVHAMWTSLEGKALNYNPGICCNDYLTFDLDVKDGKDGIKAFAEIAKELGLTTDTIVARTPTGGRHVFYKLPNGAKARNTVGELGEGVDTRGLHGYVVAPGSAVPAGEYTWIRPPGSCEMATATEAALARVLFTAKERPKPIEGLELDSPGAIDQAIRWLVDDAPEATEGWGGDNQTYRNACVVRSFGVSEETCLDLMAEHWNQDKAHPPWPIDLLEVKVANAYSYAQSPAGSRSAEADFDAVELEEPEKATEDEKTDKADDTTGGASREQEEQPKSRALPFWNCDPNEKPAPKGWLIKDVAARGETAGWIGPPGSGKSAAVLDVFMHGATGKDWRGHKCKEKTAFVYFAFERAMLTRRRILAYAQQWGLTTVPIAVVNRVLNLLDTKGLPVILDTIKAAEDLYGMSVGGITFDTFPKGIAAGGGDENSARDVNMVATNLRRLHEKVNLHIALIGHTGKDETKGSRGSNANQGDWDVDFRIARIEDGIKTLRVEKANDQEEGPITAFRLKPVKIGIGEDLENIMTSILNEDIPAAPDDKGDDDDEDRLSDTQALAMRALSECLEKGTNPEFLGMEHIAERLVCTLGAWRDRLLSTGIIEIQANGGHRKVFERLWKALLRKNRIGKQEAFVWMT